MSLLSGEGSVLQISSSWVELNYGQQLNEIYDIFLEYYVFQNENLVISSIIFLEQTYTNSLYLYVTILFMVIILYYISVVGYILWSNISYGQFLFNLNFNYLGEIEGEYGASEDYLGYLMGLLLLVFWYYLFTLFLYYIWERFIHSLLVGWVLLICLTWLLPLITLGNFGVGFTSYIRGSGKSSLVIVEVLLDYIAVSVIFIRFFIQNIRFLLIFLAYFELFEFLNLQLYFNVLQQITVFDYISWVEKSNISTFLLFLEFVFNLIWISILYFYYVIHLTILYLVQIGIYFLLSFWLFGFLFTSFTLTPLERHFFLKRYLLTN